MHVFPVGNLTPGLLSDSQRYLPLYFRGWMFKVINLSFVLVCSIWNDMLDNTKRDMAPRRGIEPRSPEWQSEILTTILPGMNILSNQPIFCLLCSRLNVILATRKTCMPRRLGMEPLSPEWQSEILTTILPGTNNISNQPIFCLLCSRLNDILATRKTCMSPRWGIEPRPLLSDSQRYLPLYYREWMFKVINLSFIFIVFDIERYTR